MYKNAHDEVAALEMSQLSDEEAIESGATVLALAGLGAASDEGMETGSGLGAEAAADGIHVFTGLFAELAKTVNPVVAGCSTTAGSASRRCLTSWSASAPA